MPRLSKEAAGRLLAGETVIPSQFRKLPGFPRAAYSVLQEADVSLLILSYLRRPQQIALIDTNTVLRASVARALCIMLEDAIVETVMPPPRFTTFVVPAHKIGPKLGFTHALDMLSFASNSSVGQKTLAAHILDRLMHHAIDDDAVLLWPRECPIGGMIGRYYEQTTLLEGVVSLVKDDNSRSIVEALRLKFYVVPYPSAEEVGESSAVDGCRANASSLLERILGVEQLRLWATHNFDTLEAHRIPPLVHGVDVYAMKRIAESCDGECFVAATEDFREFLCADLGKASKRVLTGMQDVRTMLPFGYDHPRHSLSVSLASLCIWNAGALTSIPDGFGQKHPSLASVEVVACLALKSIGTYFIAEAPALQRIVLRDLPALRYLGDGMAQETRLLEVTIAKTPVLERLCCVAANCPKLRAITLIGLHSLSVMSDIGTGVHPKQVKVKVSDVYHPEQLGSGNHPAVVRALRRVRTRLGLAKEQKKAESKKKREAFEEALAAL